MAMAGLFPIGLLGELVSIGTLLAFVIVCAGVIVLRYTDPEPGRVRSARRWCRSCRSSASCACVYLMIQPAEGHLGPAHRLDGHRARDLFPVRAQSLQGGQTKRREQ